MSSPNKTLREAALLVLREHGPMHYQDLTREILDRRLATSTSQTPAASLNAVIAVDIKSNGTKSEFIRIRPGVFGLRGVHEAPVPASVPAEGEAGESAAEGSQDTTNSEEQRVRVPLFPSYHWVRHLLRVWPGRPKRQITGLQTTIGELRGTPQKTVDWTDPDQWIPERLSGDDRELALAVWTNSDRTVNPRYTYGHWLLCQKYELIEEDAAGCIQLTARGRDFLDNSGGETETWLDEQEGLVKLLALVADNGPTRPRGMIEEWADYLHRRSSFNSPSTIQDTLRRRLSNLCERGLVERKGSMYSISESGLAYLGRVGDEDAPSSDEQREIWTLIRQQEESVRESLRELLLEMDPYGFEHLVKRLLEEMDYQNVVVTAPANDGGVDVAADIELGITSVREVVQAKRHRRPVQRKDLDALRGSLYRFNAVRGTIITTSRFSKGTQEAAFATGAAPITLIDGNKLIDLLIQHNVGVKKRTVEILEVDTDAFADFEPNA